MHKRKYSYLNNSQKPQSPDQKHNITLQKISLDLTKLINSTSKDSNFPVRVSEINRMIIKEISTTISKLNIELFLTRFNNLDFKHKEFLIKSESPIIDDYSRVSYCCIVLGPHKLPVYQPGTIMFLSGVKSKCPLEVFHKNCGQNGPILGMSCALFLAKFMSHLSSNYQTMCKAEGHDSKEFIPHIYNNSLTNCLYFYSKEDAEQHGRLREIQKMLFRFDDRVMPMTREEEMQFYLNDVKAFKEAKNGIPTKEDDMEEFREDHVFYDGWGSLFNEEKTERILEKILPRFKTQILGKKGIFPDNSCYKIVEEKIKELENRYSINHGIKRNDEYMNEFSESDRKKITYEKFLKSLAYRDASCPSERMKFRGGFLNKSTLGYDFEREGSVSFYSTERPITIKIRDMEVETVKQSLRPFFQNKKISNLGIFDSNNHDLGRAFKRVSRLIQPVRKIFEDSGINMEHKELKKEMENFEKITKNYNHITTYVSKALASFRDHFLDDLKNQQKSNEIIKMIIGGEFYSHMEELIYSKYEILAIRDTKILESAFFMYSKFIQKTRNGRLDTLEKLLEKLLNILADYESYVLDLSEKSPYKESSLANSIENSVKKNGLVDFSQKMISNPYIPVYLKRKESEGYEKYLKRITEFLKDYNIDRLNEILGEIDPCEEENEPAIGLLSGIIKEKKENTGCSLI